MELRIVHKEEIEDMVAIHCAAFRDFFLTELGPDFLTTYYEAFRKSDRAILVGCFENDRLLGFSAGVYVSAGFKIAACQGSIGDYRYDYKGNCLSA